MAGFRAAAGCSTVDAVFSSERYGAELARRFGAVAVTVDLDRVKVPVSGTAVRADPIAHWDLLGPGVRAWLTRRVIVVGAESSGTTTMARALARQFRLRGGVWAGTRWVPEFGRELTSRKLEALRLAEPDATVDEVVWDRTDFVRVAREQNAAEDAAARAGSPILFGDTDAASCRTAGSGQPTPQIAAYAEKAVQAGFRDTTVRSGGVALALIILAFGLAFPLPRQMRPESAGH